MSDFAYGVKVEPSSIKKLFEEAKVIREILKLTNTYLFPVPQFLELLQQMNFDGFDFEVVEDTALDKNTFAQFNPITCLLSIKNSIYEKCVQRDGFARFIVMHEICHFWLHRKQAIALTRKVTGKYKIFEDSEWQANTLASQIMAPLHMVKDDMTVEDIASTFGLSIPAAKVVKAKSKEEKYMRWSM